MKLKFLLALLLLMFLATAVVAAVSSDTASSAPVDKTAQCDQPEANVAGIPSLDDQVEVNTEPYVDKEVALGAVEIAIADTPADNAYYKDYNAHRNRDLSALISAEYTADNQRNIPLKWSTSAAVGLQST